jgi:ATP-binding cassette subfamily B protein
VFAYITYRVGRVRREVSTLTQRSLAEVSAITEESLSVSGILLSKTFGQQRASVARFAKESRRLGDLQIRQQMVGRWFFAMIGTFFSIAPAFVYLLAGTLIINGDRGVSVGTIVAFTTLQSRLFFPMGQLLNVQVEIQGALALFDRIFEYLEMEQDIRDAPDAVTLDPVAMRGNVRFADVSFRYPRTPLQLAAAAEAEQAEADGRAVVRCHFPSGRSAWRTSASTRGPGSSWRWWGPRVLARPRRRTSSRASTTWMRARSRSMGWMCGRSRWSHWVARSAW